MQFNKTVKNHMLLGCIQLMKEDDTPEHRTMFLSELENSEFYAPALVTPEPVTDPITGDMTLDPKSKIQFPMLPTTDGRCFLMAFTDDTEYQKWVDKNAQLPKFVMNLEDFAGMMFVPDAQGKEAPAIGLVINPLGCNVVIPRELLAGIYAGKLPEVQEYIHRQSQMQKKDSEKD